MGDSSEASKWSESMDKYLKAFFKIIRMYDQLDE